MRWVVIGKFQLELSSLEIHPVNIAVLGGSSNDPEVTILNELFPKSKITYLGIDNYGNEKTWKFIDLNLVGTIADKFDLIICSQVLEHIWNLSNAFKTISQITKENGYIWINCPTSNMAHGSPEYYSAGYSPDFLRLNFEEFDFTTLSVGSFGSKRYYNAVHYLRHWSTQEEHRHPIFGYRISGVVTLGKIREMITRIPGRFCMSFWNRQITSDIEFSTESYYFGRKIHSLPH